MHGGTNLVVLFWVFCFGSGPFLLCIAVFSRCETQIWPEDLSSFGFGAFCCACVIRFAVLLVEPLCFMLSFLIRLPAYPHVRTESQSDIGHNREKKAPPQPSNHLRSAKG
jgi:hypothetical protein